MSDKRLSASAARAGPGRGATGFFSGSALGTSGSFASPLLERARVSVASRRAGVFARVACVWTACVWRIARMVDFASANPSAASRGSRDSVLLVLLPTRFCLAESRSGSASASADARRLRTSRAARAATGSSSSSDPRSAREGSQSTCAGAGALRSKRWTPRNGAAAVQRAGVRTAPRRRWEAARMPSARARRPALEAALATTRTPACTDAGAFTHAIGPRTRPPDLQTPTARPATAARRVRPRRNARSRQNAPPREKRATPRAGPRSTRTRDARLATPYRLDAREKRGRLLSRLDPRGSSLAHASPPQLNYGTGGGDPT